MKLRFGQIEEVLQCVHCIPKGERSQFRAKLRNLFRVGLDLPSGRVGRRANYDIADMLKLAFAAEILEIGLPPEKTAVMVEEAWSQISLQLFAIWRGMKDDRWERRFLVAWPAALTEPHHRFQVLSLEELQSRLASVVPARCARLLVIDPAAILSNILLAISTLEFDLAGFEAELDSVSAVILKYVDPKTGHMR